MRVRFPLPACDPTRLCYQPESKSLIGEDPTCHTIQLERDCLAPFLLEYLIRVRIAEFIGRVRLQPLALYFNVVLCRIEAKHREKTLLLARIVILTSVPGVEAAGLRKQRVVVLYQKAPQRFVYLHVPVGL